MSYGVCSQCQQKIMFPYGKEKLCRVCFYANIQERKKEQKKLEKYIRQLKLDISDLETILMLTDTMRSEVKERIMISDFCLKKGSSTIDPA